MNHFHQWFIHCVHQWSFEILTLVFFGIRGENYLSMTRASTLDFRRKTQGQNNWSGPLRPVNAIKNKFPTYKNGMNGIVIKFADEPETPWLKESVAKETADLLDRRQRLSVRELAMKFEKGLSTATLLSNEVWVFLIPEHSFSNWFSYYRP